MEKAVFGRKWQLLQKYRFLAEILRSRAVFGQKWQLHKKIPFSLKMQAMRKKTFLAKNYNFGQILTIFSWLCALRGCKKCFCFSKKPIIWMIIRFLAIKMIKFRILISGDDGKITFWTLFGSLGMKNWTYCPAQYSSD